MFVVMMTVRLGVIVLVRPFWSVTDLAVLISMQPIHLCGQYPSD